MITFIESGNHIATENFATGGIYTITFTNGNYRTMCCIGIGSDFVMFQGTMPNTLFCLTMGTSETVVSIDIGGGGGGSMNYNELENKPQINGIVLIGNKTSSDLGLLSQADLDNYVTDTELTTELADYATNASVVSALASKQDQLTATQLTAVNSGITSDDVTQITTNKNNISKLTPNYAISVCPVTNDYSCIAALTQTIPTASIARISATIDKGNTSVRGIILSLTDDISTFNNGDNLLSKDEQSVSDKRILTLDAMYYNGSSSNTISVYIWVKGAGTGAVMGYSSLEKLK